MSSRSSLWLIAASALLVVVGCRSSGASAQSEASAAPPRAADSRQAPRLRRVRIIAVGDIMLDRAVGAAIRRNGASSILQCVADRLRDADITFANLECPLSRSGPHSPKDCVFRADPAAVKVLIHGGIDIVSLANNHTLNSGRRPLLDTMDLLERFGIAYCGARRQRENSWWPVYFDVGGLRIGFMAYTDLSFAHGSYNKVSPDMSNLVEQVSIADSRCDILVVSFHWGEEYHPLPTRRQRQVARAAIDAGADLIHGHHPHVLESIAAYRGVPILYSMGNFVFDQRPGVKMESAIFELEYVEVWGWDLRAVPVVISRKRFGPEYPPPQRARKIAQRLVELSAKLGTYPSIAEDNTVRLHISAEKAIAADTFSTRSERE